MFTTIINDCRDDNVMARQATRALVLLENPVSTLGVSKDIEAAGNIIDVLDASHGRKGIIMTNVAPRHGKAKKWPNGTPFGFFHYKETLVLSTIDGLCLSLVKKLKLVDHINLTDIPTVTDAMVKQGYLREELKNHIINTQFRSYDYMPRLANWLSNAIDVPCERYDIEKVDNAPLAVWWVDNFGNCKTTILPEEIGHEHGKKIKTKVGEITCYNRLKDVPNSEPGLVIGSSGLGDKRFIELVMQGKSATEKFGLKTGDELI